MRPLIFVAVAAAAIVPAIAGPPASSPRPRGLPGPRDMAESHEDLWGEAAIHAPGGPSYEFFENLLPPLRYVNTAFRHYPIVLSAPLAPVKARFISNGSGINLHADKPPMWKEAGVPVRFFVGEKCEPFGEDITRLFTQQFSGGDPIAVLRYRSGETDYQQGAFASVSPGLAKHGTVQVEFRAFNRHPGRVVARVEGEIEAVKGALLDKKGWTILCYGSNWKWDAEKKELVVLLAEKEGADLAIFTNPPTERPKGQPDFEPELRRFERDWAAIRLPEASFSLPEPIVDRAWRTLVAGNFMIAAGDRMHYSAGNAYDHLYEAECGDAVRSLLHFGYADTARKMVGPLLDFNRQATRFHVAGHKLQLLAHYYWLTRDREYLNQTRAKWEGVVEFIRTSHKTDNGLLPKDRYAGDINSQVYSLNSNAACWRGLRDMAAVLDDLCEKQKSAELRKEADALRKAILDAVAKSVRVKEKFVPVALLADEPAHDPLTATRQGSYYDLIIPYVLDSGIFPPGDERESWIIDYLRHHGGIAMGMIRSTPHQGEFNNEPGVNVLYGLRYNLTLLRRGDREHALVAFYAQLAQGMTRGTFIGGEGSRFFRGDEHGRSFYLPPNSASNATFLSTLRYLMIQDWDLDDDGKPETLRLLDAIPQQWIRDGTKLRVERAPSAFGEVAVIVTPQLTAGEVLVDLQAPSRPVAKWTLRLPEPPGYTITGAKIDNKDLKRDAAGRVDLTGRTGKFQVVFSVKPIR